MNGNPDAVATRTSNVRKLTMLALLSAIAYAVMLFGRIPVIAFLKYDPKDVVITIAGFLFGPTSAVLISFVVSVVEMVTVSSTGFIGLIMNVLSTCAFACTAAVFYQRRHTMKGAVTGLISGCVLMTAVMLLWNYLITPLYMALPREDVIKMLIPVFLPFNLVKGALNAALTLLLYKPLVGALRRSGLLAKPQGVAPTARTRLNAGAMMAAAVVLATCILFILVMQKVI